MLGRFALAIFVVVAASFGVACDSGDSHTTAVVDSISSGRLCITPEDRQQTDLVGCFSVTPHDESKLQPGMCIELRIPNELDEKRRNHPVYGLHVLSRSCRSHG